MTVDSLWGEIEALGPIARQANGLPLRPETAYQARFGWGVPSRQAIRALIRFAAGRPIHEVGAGCGLWACLLKHAGARVHASDGFSDVTNTAVSGVVSGRRPTFYFPVVRADSAEAADRAPAHSVLLMVWPPSWNPMAAAALAAFRGDRVAYMGEERGGVTAADDFFDLLDTRWTPVESHPVPQWALNLDKLTLYRRARRAILRP